MNITPGTALWAIQQMLNGKKVRYNSWGPEEYIYIKDDAVYSEDDNVQSLTQSMFDFTGWLLWAPPNPYPKGTFAWAWEEIQRGNKVRLNSVAYEKDTKHCVLATFNGDPIGPIRFIDVVDINSTNWELIE